jgi:hypothetical protein
MKIMIAKRWLWHLLVSALLAAGAVGWPGPAAAVEPRHDAWIPVDATRLDGLRGGFVLPSGLQVSFGFERMVWVGGELVSSLRIVIPDMANISVEQAQELSRLGGAELVQVGPGNVFQGGGGAGLVLQNSLDGVDIRAMTTIDVATNSLDMLQAANFAEALGLAGISAIGAP